jgi:hypothetical protein
MATSYFRERARTYRARNPFSRYPSDDEDPTITPTFDQPMPPPGMAPVIQSQSGAAPYSSIPLADPIETARENYMAGAPTGAKNRIIQALMNAGLGFLQGASRDPENPIAAGIGGAAAGGLISGVSPKTGRGYQFETLQRPVLEDQLRRQEAQRQRQRQIEGDALKTEETRADIELKRSQAIKARTPATPRAVNPLRGRPGDVFLDPATGQPIGQIPAAPKEIAPHPITFQGVTYDYNNPQDRARLEAAQAKLPRDKFGRFISRSDERAAARAAGGGDEERSTKAMRNAVAAFNHVKAGLEEATRRGDSNGKELLRKRLNSIATDISQKWGDQLEVGFGSGYENWPYVKPREGAQTPAQTSAPSLNAKQRAIFDDIKREQPGVSDERILFYMRSKGWY